jgi:hypothetical protein
VNYIIKKHRVDVTICAEANPDTDAYKFRDSVYQSFAECRALVEGARAAKL